MGCNESREKESPPIHFTFAVATPLPLHIYQYVYPIKKSPTSLSPISLSPTSRTSTTSLSPTSLSPTSLSPTAKASQTTKSTATLHYNKLRAMAHYKFPDFKEFPRGVQEQILGHIEKEFQSTK